MATHRPKKQDSETRDLLILIRAYRKFMKNEFVAHKLTENEYVISHKSLVLLVAFDQAFGEVAAKWRKKLKSGAR